MIVSTKAESTGSRYLREYCVSLDIIVVTASKIDGVGCLRSGVNASITDEERGLFEKHQMINSALVCYLML